MPLTDIIIVGVTDPNRRALAMGLSRTIWAIPSVFVPYLAAMIVSNFGGINVNGIRPLYFTQILAFLLAIIFVLVMLEPLYVQRSSSQRGVEKISVVEGYRELIKSEKWLKHWLFIMAIMRFGFISMPFVPLWIVNIRGADQYLLGLMGTLSALASLLLQIPLGMLADKIGPRKFS